MENKFIKQINYLNNNIVNSCVLYVHSLCFILHGHCVNLIEAQKYVNFLHNFTSSYVYLVYNTVYHTKNENMCCCRLSFYTKCFLLRTYTVILVTTQFVTIIF